MLLESLTDKDAGMAALGGSRHEVDLSLIDNPQPGDYLIVHAGFAIEKLDTEEAEARLRLFDELAATP
jgi:hydrogenase expression/formation protein HypC